MFSVLRQPRGILTRAFSSTPSRASDVSKLILIGRLGKVPEVRLTRNEKEYVAYTVATSNYPPPPPGPDGTRPESKTTWHHVVSFHQGANNFLRNLQKGSHVYVEANFEVREADPTADPSTPWGQRQIFLRHENLRLLRGPALPVEENTESEESTEERS